MIDSKRGISTDTNFDLTRYYYIEDAMFFLLLFWIISSPSLFLTIQVPRIIGRHTFGDILHSTNEDFNCTSLGANQVSTGTCVCRESGSYYTDRSGKSRCFKGRGEEELGKIFVKTDLVKLFIQTYYMIQ